MIEVLPTILTHDAEIAKQRLSILRGHTDWIQVDVIDGVFAKNTTLEASAFPEELGGFAVEVQLMVVDPVKFIQDWYQAGARRVIIHVESSGDVGQYLSSAKKLGLDVGIGIAPSTPLEKAVPFFSIVDRVLVLAVAPGFAGGKFHNESLDRIAQIKASAPFLPIEIDGAVTPETAKKARAAGATSFAVNSYLFSSSDPLSALQEVRQSVGL